MTEQGLMAWTEGQGITPRNVDELMKLADMLSKSAFVPACYKDKPGDIIAAMQHGSEVGLKAMQSLQSIAVINGRPSIWGDGWLGLILASSVYDKHEEAYTGTGPSLVATCSMWRKGNPTPFVGTFGVANATEAGLLTKQTYQQWKREMFMWRARHRAGQAAFADVTKGLIPAEIATDYPVKEVVATVVMPKRRSAPPPPPPEPAVVIDAPAAPPEQGDAYEPPVEQEPPPAAPAPLPPTPPAATATSDPSLITDKQRKRFYAIAKNSGKSDDQIRAYIKDKLGIEHTDKIKHDVYEVACAWAALPADQS